MFVIYWLLPKKGTYNLKVSELIVRLLMEHILLWQLIILVCFPRLFDIFFLFLRIFYLFYIQFSAFMYDYGPEEGTRMHYRWLWATSWFLGTHDLWKSSSALDFWAIPLAPWLIFSNDWLLPVQWILLRNRTSWTKGSRGTN